MPRTHHSENAPTLRVLFAGSNALIIALCLFLAACQGDGKSKVDLVNPESGLLGFNLGTSREAIPAQAEKLRLKYAETRILREEPEDLVTDFYTGKVWGKEALIYISSRGFRIRNIMNKYEFIHKGEEFADAIRASLCDALGEPDSSTQNVVGRKPDYVKLHDTTWCYGDISVSLSTHAPDNKTGMDISLSYYLTTIR